MSRTSIAAAALGSATLAAFALTGSSTSIAASPVSAGVPAAHTAAQPAAGNSAAAVVKQSGHGKHKVATFNLVRSAGVVKAGCLPNAKAKVKVTPGGEAETMKVWVSGLPAHTEFDFFVLQVPDAPFGMAWYQGDIETNKHGNGYAKFRGRFNEETFSVAVGPAAAPTPHDGDANVNPVTKPLHQYHLGFWFNDPADAAKAGCGNLVTPFNGEHNAGTQAMSTRQFPAADGPLGRIKS